MTGMLKTAEHSELVAQFEKDFKGCGRMDKEPKELWPRGAIYQDGAVNNMFKAYRIGYAYGKCYERQEA